MAKIKGRPLKNKIREFRLRKKISQSELAVILGVTRQTIISLEKNRYSPSLAFGLRLSKFFKTKVEKIFSL